MAPIPTTPKKAKKTGGNTPISSPSLSQNSTLGELLRSGNMLHVQNLYVINTDHHPGPIILQQGATGTEPSVPFSLSSPRRTIKKEKGEKTSMASKMKNLSTPKRPTSSFFFFARENRPLIRAAFPENRGAEIAKEVGRQWQSLGVEGKKRYEEMAQKDKERYQEEMANFMMNPKSQTVSTKNTTDDNMDDLYD